MQLEGPTAGGLMYFDTVIKGLGDRYRCVVPKLPFGAHTASMPDGADLSLLAIATMVAGFLS
ncbi:MAG: hypothetical protein OXH28_02205 [bacterium]|nr:hypothetical protein [bacterium]